MHRDTLYGAQNDGWVHSGESYNDIGRANAQNADRKRKSILSTLYLTPQNNDEKLIPVRRNEMKAICAYTALNQEDGTSILLHKTDKQGCHKAVLTADTAEDVQGIIEGNPTQNMLEYWKRFLQTLQNDEYEATKFGFKRLHKELQSGCRTKYERQVLEQERLKTNAENGILDIERDQKDRGVMAGLGSYISGNSKFENDELNKLQGKISEFKQKVTLIKREGENESAALERAYLAEIAKLDDWHAKRMETENQAEQLEQLSGAFKVVMKRYKDAEDSAQAAAGADSKRNSSDDNEDVFDLELQIDRSIEEPNADLDADVVDEITDKLWKRLAQSITIETWDEIRKRQLENEYELEREGIWADRDQEYDMGMSR